MRVVREDDGNRYRTANEMTLEFHHAGTDLNADSYAEWTESHDGQPLHLVVARKDKTNLANSDIGKPSVWEKTRDGDPQSLLTSKHEWEFNGPRATQIIHRDNELVRLPDFIPNGEWLTPAAAERFIHRQISENAAAMEYGTLEASDTLRVVHVHSTLVGPSDFAFDGRMIPVTVWSTGTSASAAQATSHYSHDGKLVYSSNDLGIGVLETRMCRKDEALAAAGPASAPQLDYPVVKPDRALIAKSRTAFEIRLKQGKLPRLPSAGAQVAEMSEDDSSARVTVDAARTSAATEPELADAALRERSPMMGSDDSDILDLAAQSIRQAEGLGALELAKSSRAIIFHRFAVREPAGSTVPSVASAIQARDTGAEPARMLCAVLRVHRIASRMASGLAYSAPPRGGDGLFEWRIWTQAMLDGRWVDLDPLSAEPFDARHILTGFAGVGMANTNPDPASFAKLLSSLEIKVVSQE